MTLMVDLPANNLERGAVSRSRPKHRYSATDHKVSLIVGPFDPTVPIAEPVRRALPANAVQIFRKGESPKLHTLEADLAKALEHRWKKVELSEYERYRQQSMERRARTNRLLEDERDDPRLFEARACAVNPKGPFIDWFITLSDNQRRLLVGVSREAGVVYLKPGQIDPGIAHIEWLKRIISTNLG